MPLLTRIPNPQIFVCASMVECWCEEVNDRSNLTVVLTLQSAGSKQNHSFYHLVTFSVLFVIIYTLDLHFV